MLGKLANLVVGATYQAGMAESSMLQFTLDVLKQIKIDNNNHHKDISERIDLLQKYISESNNCDNCKEINSKDNSDKFSKYGNYTLVGTDGSTRWYNQFKRGAYSCTFGPGYI